MRKLLVLVAATAVVVVAAGTAQSAVFNAGNSWLQLKIGGLPRQDVKGKFNGSLGGLLQVGLTAGPKVVMLGSVDAPFQTVAKPTGAPFFSATANISNLFLTVVNPPATFEGGATAGAGTGAGNWIQGALGPAFGGAAGLVGDDTIELLGGFATVPVPLDSVGAGGQATATIGLLTATVFVDGAPWLTSSIQITGILTNVASIINGTRIGVTGAPFTLSATPGEDTTVVTENGLAAVRIAGTESLSVSGPGFVTLVTPVYLDATGATMRAPLPSAAFMTLRFVPEPGTMLLLGSAVAGLLVVGRKRMKR